jgi:hypothetical protein
MFGFAPYVPYTSILLYFLENIQKYACCCSHCPWGIGNLLVKERDHFRSNNANAVPFLFLRLTLFDFPNCFSALSVWWGTGSFCSVKKGHTPPAAL